MKSDKMSELDRNEVEFFDRVYGDQAYNLTGNRLKSERELRSLLKLQAGRGLGRILSIGCGEGEFERMLSPHAEHITALDISPKAVEVAQQRNRQLGLGNIDVHCLSVFDLNWEDRFDTIICLAFLHHVPEAELSALLERIYTHVRPGGLFYSQDPNEGGILRIVGRVVLGDRYDHYHSVDERELVPEELQLSLQAAGFQNVDIIPIDLTLIPSMFMLAKRPGWILHVCAWVDRLFCASPFRRWASGFVAASRKAA